MSYEDGHRISTVIELRQPFNKTNFCLQKITHIITPSSLSKESFMIISHTLPDIYCF